MSVDKQILHEHETLANLKLGAGAHELQNYMLGIATDTCQIVHRIGATYYQNLCAKGSLTHGSIPWVDSDGTIQEDNDGVFFDHNNIRLGVGTASPDCTAHFYGGSAGTVAADASAIVCIEDNAAAVLQLLSPAATGYDKVYFGNEGDVDDGYISYENSAHSFVLGTASTARMSLDTAALQIYDSIRMKFLDSLSLVTLELESYSDVGYIRFKNATTGRNDTDGTYISGSGTDLTICNQEQGATIFVTGAAERMRSDENGIMFASAGGATVAVRAATSAPTAPRSGMLWLDTTSGNGTLKCYANSGWRTVTAF